MKRAHVRLVSLNWITDTMDEEALRESSCNGNLLTVRKILSKGISVNSQNVINGWTALHWACKRDHIAVIELLLANGADISVKNFDQKTALDLASSEAALTLLGCPEEEKAERIKSAKQSTLPFVPHYLRNPVFPYDDHGNAPQQPPNTFSEPDLKSHPLLLKIRLSGEDDFVEVELNLRTHQALLAMCAEELEIELSHIHKVRKLPDTLVRKDCDVQRLKDGQRLEVVLFI